MADYTKSEQAALLRQWAQPIAVLRQASEQALSALYVFARYSGMVPAAFQSIPYGAVFGRPEPTPGLWGYVSSVKDGPVSRGNSHPVLVELRSRAAISLLSWLGVDWVPGRLLRALRDESDPALAIESLASQLRCDCSLLKRRDPVTLSTFRTRLRLICQTEADNAALTPAEKNRLDAFQYFGRHDKVTALESVIADLNEAVVTHSIAATLGLPCMSLARSQAGLMRRSAPGIPPDKAHAALEKARNCLDLARLFAIASDMHDDLVTTGDGIADDSSISVIREQLNTMRGVLRRDTRANASVLIPDYYNQVVLAYAEALSTLGSRHEPAPRAAQDLVVPMCSRPMDLQSAAADYFGLPRHTAPSEEVLARATSRKLAALRESGSLNPIGGDVRVYQELLAWRRTLRTGIPLHRA